MSGNRTATKKRVAKKAPSKATTKKAVTKRAPTPRKPAAKTASQPAKKAAAPAKDNGVTRDAKPPKLINYDPANEYVPPREGTKGAALIKALSRKNGATLIELAEIIAECNREGIGGKSPETERYARSWLPSSYLRNQFGVGLRSEHCKQGGKSTLRVWAIIPENVRERKRAKPTAKPASERPSRVRRPKGGSITSEAPQS